jgi:hypothetical protein
MNDITKARYFLKNRASDLQHLESFSLMLTTAEKIYKDIKMRQASNTAIPGTWDQQETEAALDYALLKYLKKHNHLPTDAVKAIRSDISVEEKKGLIVRWVNAL